MNYNTEFGLNLNIYKKLKTLGCGTHGKVILVERIEDKKKLAVKIIKKSKNNNKKQLYLIKREVEIMTRLSHPNIISVYDVIENNNYVTIIMEYASKGELFDYINNLEEKTLTNQSQKQFSFDKKEIEEEIKRIFRQISSAVYYMHKRNIVHRDLKLENILLDKNFNVKIGDFGLSNRFSSSHFLFTFCGSPLYASPEIVQTMPYVGPEVDSWSLGVILYSMLFKKMPFSDSNIKNLKTSIIESCFYLPIFIDKDLKDLINGLLNPKAEKRMTLNQVLNNNWLEVDPKEEQIKNFFQIKKSNFDDFAKEDNFSVLKREDTNEKERDLSETKENGEPSSYFINKNKRSFILNEKKRDKNKIFSKFSSQLSNSYSSCSSIFSNQNFFCSKVKSESLTFMNRKFNIREEIFSADNFSSMIKKENLINLLKFCASGEYILEELDDSEDNLSSMDSLSSLFFLTNESTNKKTKQEQISNKNKETENSSLFSYSSEESYIFPNKIKKQKKSCLNRTKSSNMYLTSFLNPLTNDDYYSEDSLEL